MAKESVITKENLSNKIHLFVKEKWYDIWFWPDVI